MSDFPVSVALDEKMPSWELNRWDENSGLRFIPPCDENYTLRGDKKRLVYKGRKRSHRFTILDDTSFGYDCILEKEPESNVIPLLMEGAENFDFFRQPDFVSDPFLKGSYAIYKKQTLVGEGTGKLCHINRPEIIDAEGRRCWGDLSIAGNELQITIPENWLGGALYPVTVDQVVGTTTIGSQTHWFNPDEWLFDRLFFECSIAVNRFMLPQTMNGNATAFVYAYHDDYVSPCLPVLYSDNSNVPHTRRSADEGIFDIEVRNGKPAGWRATTFRTNTSIAGGTNVWFGLSTLWFAPRFDYGAKCFWEFWDFWGDLIPNTFPLWNIHWYYDLKISMYFTYSASQNYVRTLTQGVSLTDRPKLKGEYKRRTNETTAINTTFTRTGIFNRNLLEKISLEHFFSQGVSFFRSLHLNVQTLTETIRNAGYNRSQAEKVKPESNIIRSLFLFVRIASKISLRDFFHKMFFKTKDEIILKSQVCREIILESGIK